MIKNQIARLIILFRSAGYKQTTDEQVALAFAAIGNLACQDFLLKNIKITFFFKIRELEVRLNLFTYYSLFMFKRRSFPTSILHLKL